MSEIVRQGFSFQGKRVRTLTRDGEPLLAAPDVCAILEHSKTVVAMRLVDEEDKVLIDLRETDIPKVNRTLINPNMWFVTESGFYTLVFASQASGAKAFRRWVTSEVLPSIRRTGKYEATPTVPQTYADALQLAADQAREIEAQAARLAIAEPQAHHWEVLASGTGDYQVADAAKILARDPAITTGRDRLFAAMSDLGWIYRSQSDGGWRAYQQHVDNGRLRELPTSYEHPRTHEMTLGVPQIRVTVKGLAALHRALGGQEALEVPEPIAVEAW